jgi:signal transduction histidine kinase
VKDHFKSSGNVVRMLGEQLVSNKFVALLELIKNAYDADARLVNIDFDKIAHPITKKKGEAVVVSDSGHGSTIENISKRWLVLGTANKEKLRFSPGGRRMLGAKGIGRFAIQRLGEYCKVSTVPDPAVLKVPDSKPGASLRYAFEIDWDKVTDPTRILEDYDLEIGESPAKARDHGTKVTVYELRDEWTKEDIDRLQREISSLLPPGFSEKFTVAFSHWKFVPTTERLTSSVLDYATYSIKGRADGKKHVAFEENGKKGTLFMDTSVCGPFSFEIYAYDEGRIRDDYRGGASKIISAVNEFHGIKVYRDGFRVKPYGDRGTDWLGLDKHRVKLVTRFGSGATIGVVRITSDKNPTLIDQTNREGIIDGAALQQFKDVLFSLVNRLSIKSASWHKTHSSKGGYQRAKRSATAAARGTQAGEEVQEFADTAERLIRSLEETNADLRSHASIGLAMLGVGHDLLEEAKLARALVREIAEHSDDSAYVDESVEALKNHVEILSSFIQVLEEFGHADNREIAALDADKTVTTFFRRYRPVLKRSESGIELQLKTGAPSAKIRMARRDLESVLINLTTNAIQTLDETVPPRIMRVTTATEKEKWTLLFEDNGPGVHPSVKQDLFERGVTTRLKQGGSGLGLNIVRTVIENARGKILLEPESELGGASFCITLPIRK